MAQFLRPDADDYNGDGWTYSTGASLFECVNESSYDDGDYIDSPSGSPNYCELGLSSVTDPESSSDHVIRVRAKRLAGGATGTAVLYEGATPRATLTLSLGTSYATAEYTLSSGEADSIGNYANLSIRLNQGANNKAISVSWVEFEVPDVAVADLDVNVLDNLNVGEDPTVSVQAADTYSINVLDNITIGEERYIAREVEPHEIDLLDNITLSDEPLLYLEVVKLVADGLIIGEDLTTFLPWLTIQVSDNLALGEEIAVTTPDLEINVSDNIDLIGPNLFADGELDDWTTDTDLTSWTETIEGSSTITKESVDVQSGNFSCEMYVDASNSLARITQALATAIDTGSAYRLSAWYKNEVAARYLKWNLKNSTNNVSLSKDGGWIAGLVTQQFDNSQSWLQYTQGFVPHIGYTDYVLLFERGSTWDSSHWIDLVELREVDGGRVSLEAPSVPTIDNLNVGEDPDATTDDPLIDLLEAISVGEDTPTASIGPAPFTVNRLDNVTLGEDVNAAFPAAADHDVNVLDNITLGEEPSVAVQAPDTYATNVLDDIALGDTVDVLLPELVISVADDVFLGGPELFGNPSFDVDTTGWDGGVDATLASITGGVDGTNCLEITRVSADYQFARAFEDLIKGQGYRFEGSVKSGSSGDENYGVAYYSAGEGWFDLSSPHGTTSDSWVKWSETFTPPADDNYSLLLYKWSATAGTMLYDEVSLRSVDTAYVTLEAPAVNALDNITLGEDPNAFLPVLTPQATDNITLGESREVLRVTPGEPNISIEEGVAVGEVAGADLDLKLVNVLDALTVGEEVNASLGAAAEPDINVADDIALGEDPSVALAAVSAREANVLDNITLGEVVGAATGPAPQEANVLDNVVLGEDVNVAIETPVREVSVEDGLTVADPVASASVGPAPLGSNVLDDVALGEALVVALSAPAVDVLDAVSIGEVVDSYITELYLSVEDGITVGEVPGATIAPAPLEPSVEDGVTLGEDVAVETEAAFGPGVSDAITLGEYAAASIVKDELWGTPRNWKVKPRIRMFKVKPRKRNFRAYEGEK